MTSVFVYGTLKRGGSNHRHLLGQRFLGPARTAPGYTLYALGGYPGMVPDLSDTTGVVGELWSVDAPCLARLDVLEGLAEGLYRRTRIALQPPFDATPAETYLYARSTESRAHLGSEWFG